MAAAQRAGDAAHHRFARVVARRAGDVVPEAVRLRFQREAEDRLLRGRVDAPTLAERRGQRGASPHWEEWPARGSVQE